MLATAVLVRPEPKTLLIFAETLSKKDGFYSSSRFFPEGRGLRSPPKSSISASIAAWPALA